MVVFTVKLGTSGLTSKALVEKGRNNEKMCTGNAAITLPLGFLAALGAACDALEKADLEVVFNGGRIAYQKKFACERTLRDLIKELGGYAQGASQGDEAKILSFGFEVRKPGHPVVKVGQAANLRYVPTIVSGEVPLRWDHAANAISYEVSANTVDPNDESKWEQLIITSKLRFNVEGLKSGSPTWFRVQAVGRKGLTGAMSIVLKAFAV